MHSDQGKSNQSFQRNPFRAVTVRRRSRAALEFLLKDSRLFDDFEELADRVGEQRAEELGDAWIAERERLLS